MIDDDGKKSEIDETLETASRLHMDLARLKRLEILSAEEREEHEHLIDDLVHRLEEKRPS